MRITGGFLKGRKVECPPGEIRPAMDRARESFFAVLGDLSGKSFLDVFSGSGVCALEAVSRGAERVALVEKDKSKAKVIFKNISISPVKIKCFFFPAELYLSRSKEAFDIIYFDPPFKYGFHQDLIAACGEKGILLEGGLALIHRPRDIEMPDAPGPAMKLQDRRFYGRSVVDFYVKESPLPADAAPT